MQCLAHLAIATALGLIAPGLVPLARAGMTAPASSTIGPSPTDFTLALGLPKFDTSLGTLTAVDLSLNMSGHFGGTVTNTPESGTTGLAVVGAAEGLFRSRNRRRGA